MPSFCASPLLAGWWRWDELLLLRRRWALLHLPLRRAILSSLLLGLRWPKPVLRRRHALSLLRRRHAHLGRETALLLLLLGRVRCLLRLLHAHHRLRRPLLEPRLLRLRLLLLWRPLLPCHPGRRRTRKLLWLLLLLLLLQAGGPVRTSRRRRRGNSASTARRTWEGRLSAAVDLRRWRAACVRERRKDGSDSGTLLAGCRSRPLWRDNGRVLRYRARWTQSGCIYDERFSRNSHSTLRLERPSSPLEAAWVQLQLRSHAEHRSVAAM